MQDCDTGETGARVKLVGERQGGEMALENEFQLRTFKSQFLGDSQAASQEWSFPSLAL
jgi:hypothetical protein